MDNDWSEPVMPTSKKQAKDMLKEMFFSKLKTKYDYLFAINFIKVFTSRTIVDPSIIAQVTVQFPRIALFFNVQQVLMNLQYLQRNFNRSVSTFLFDLDFHFGRKDEPTWWRDWIRQAGNSRLFISLQQPFDPENNIQNARVYIEMSFKKDMNRNTSHQAPQLRLNMQPPPAPRPPSPSPPPPRPGLSRAMAALGIDSDDENLSDSSDDVAGVSGNGFKKRPTMNINRIKIMQKKIV
tara:strand:+ start:136 stop:846 length:711 start_codon:yes stop_codon:yes gene_type:complete